ncbi:MAG: cupin domain-containing protein [Candidatus Omnitrophica bacterium]|nr:cupin domain-containing protein [Candidatus Omnitrophota bacterium]
MSRIIAMIPARLGSKRVPRKNLRYLAGKPLICHCIETAKDSGVFDEIYINSEAEIFAQIAQESGISFYKRDEKFSTDQTNNDEFAHDFIQNTDGDILVQILPTSPLITAEEIRNFVVMMTEKKYETCVSVVPHQIACVYEGESVNFSYEEAHRSSQTMSAVCSYATVLMGWTYESFKRNIKEKGFAYHGEKGKIGFFPITGLSTIDIDHEEDFQLAEAAMVYRSMSQQNKIPKYYGDDQNESLRSEVDVPTILKKDGVNKSNFEQENTFLINIDHIIKNYDNTQSWCHRLVNTENNSATLISQMPGEGNRRHFHPDWNEWWYILRGQWKWEIEGKEHVVKEGDVIFIPKGKWHCIIAIGDEPAIRLAVSRADVAHVYKGDT